MIHLDGPALEHAAAGGTPPEHVQQCAACAAQIEALAAEQARYHAAHPPRALIVAVRTRVRHRRSERRRRAMFAGGFGLAIACAASLFVLVRSAPAVRARGAAAMLATYAQRDGETFVISDGQALRPGDRLSFAYATDGARYLLLLGLDHDGAITRYYPAESAKPEPLTATRGQLPIGLRLDDERGEERLVAVFGRNPPDERAVRTELAAALNEARQRGVGVAGMRLVLDDDHATIWFRKP